jgi:hypothetical protein
MCAHCSFMNALAPILKPVERLSARPNSSELVNSRIKWRTTRNEGRPGPPCGGPPATRQNGPPGQTKRGRVQLNPGAHLSDPDSDADSSSSKEASSTASIPWPGPFFRPLATFPVARSGARPCPVNHPAASGAPAGAIVGADATPTNLLVGRLKASGDKSPPKRGESQREQFDDEIDAWKRRWQRQRLTQRSRRRGHEKKER